MRLPDCSVTRCLASGQQSIDEAIARERPSVLVFEFDYPDPLGLSELQHTKRTFPSLPVLMLTEQHCESLAVWAFRSGARDYVTKPVEPAQLATLVGPLVAQVGGRHGERRTPRSNWMRPPPLPAEARVCARGSQRKETAAAQRFVDGHLHERIRLEEMARLCGMNLFQFSRLFKAEQGLTFRDYLLQARVRRAAELLRNAQASVADIAHAAGFRDPPYFARMFRKVMGTTPTEYRNQVAAGRPPRLPDLASAEVVPLEP
jgi:AraC-like DNA-binding protein